MKDIDPDQQLGLALYDFHAREVDELSIQKGEKFSILEKYDDGWWLVECEGEQGLIPSNYAREYDENEEPMESSRDELPFPEEQVDTENKKISRMQGEREQTNAKIDALRTVVSNYETGKLNKSPEKNSVQKPAPILSPEDDEQLSNPSPTKKSQIKRALSEKKMKPIPQVTLDPSSIDYISKLINDKITRELAARDKRILDQVHEIVQQSLSQLRIEENPQPPKFHPVPPYDPNRDSDNKSINSAQSNRSNQQQSNQNPSKIPRIRLPKVNNVYDNRKANSPRNFENTPLSAGGNNNNNNMNQLPAIKSKASLKNNQFKDEYISVEGIQYPQCRSVVYPSTTDIDLLKTRHLRKFPKLSLRHILGYDGDPSRHGGGLRGKNVIWLNQREIAFPAAAIVVVMDVHTEKQKFFVNHSDDVISLAAFPAMSVIASSQIGNDCSILIWNYRELNSNDVSPCQQLLPPTNLRGINNLCFSPDGKLLLACGIEDSRMVYIFDWQRNVLLASAKTGHSDYCQFAFNPFCYEPFDEENMNQRGSLKKGGNVNNDKNNQPELSGCYSITSISGKILKFWTLKQQIAIPPTKQRSEKKPKQSQPIQYILEGTQGQMKKSNINAFDFTAYTFIGHDAHLNYILVGLSNGSLQVWQHQIDNHNRNHQHLSWLARGKLILVIADVHEGPIMEMDFVYHDSKLITGDSSGILNIWNVHLTDKITEGLPLEHIGAVQLDNTSARSLHWNHDGLSVAIGATNNSISILKLNPLTNQEGLTEFDLQALLIAHNGKVRKLAIHPFQDNFFATICSDSSIRIWDSDAQCHVCCILIESQPTAISFSADGNFLTIGNEKGEFIILYSREFEALLTQSKHNVNNYINFEWKVVDTKSFSTSNSNKNPNNKKAEITEIKFSPRDDIVAIGLKDGTIHLLSIQNNYKHTAICRGHTSHIKNIDFSIDGKIIKSSDATRELLYWDVSSGTQITNSNIYKELQWFTFSCIYGWPLQGIFNRYDGEKLIQPDSEINCVNRSPDGLIIACAGSHTVKSAIKIFQYPAIGDAIPSLFGGHTSPVLDVAFTGPDDNLTLISAGGNDSCIFLWNVVYDSL